MKKPFLLLSAALLLFVFGSAQNQTVNVGTKKGFLYFGFGSNLSFYSRSDISFQTPTSDFTVYNVRAKDDGGIRFDNGGAPQYSYQVGYYFKKPNFGIEFNFDHIKYFVVPNQVARVKGTINGQPIDKDTALTADFLQFEHSDGANYALFNFVKMKQLYASKKGQGGLDLLLKAGVGPVFPKTNSNVMGEHYDDRYKVSGYVFALEAGVRYVFFKHFYVAPTFKGAYANYTKFLIKDGTGNQQWFGAHINLIVGGIVNL